MNIKIIRAPQFDHVYDETWGMKNRCMPPLALGIISSYLRNNGINIEQDELDIKVHNDNLYHPEENISGEVLNNKRDEILAYLQGKENRDLDKISESLIRKTNLNFDLVLISCPPSCEITPRMATFLISKSIKENYKSIIIVGGPGVGQGREDWLLAIRLKIIDFIVLGPGETPLVKLIDALKNSGDLSNIPEIIYSKNGEIFSNNNSTAQRILNIVPDFSGLPLKRYRFNIPFLEKHLQESVNILALPVQFMFGCPHQCAFCGMSTSQCRFLPAREAVDMLEKLSKKYETKYFFFLNSTLNISKEYINQFCDEIIRRNLNIYWTDCANMKQMDRDILIKMRQAGAIRLVWGLETGSSRLLKYINKGITVEQTQEILKISHEVGIWNVIELICGFPHENEEDIQHTLNFLDKIENYIGGIIPHVFYLDPNSLIRRFPDRYGITNIEEIDRAGSQEKDNPLERFHVFYKFDEINGLKWEEKRKQMAISFEKVANKISNLNFWNIASNETPVILFYLYTIFKDKKRIEEAFAKWAEHRKGQTVFSTQD